jgi:hypothetical protein
MVDYSQIKKTKKGKQFKFKIVMHFMHGDADLDTKESLEFNDETLMQKYLNLIIRILNFVPATGKSPYDTVGRYHSISDDEEKLEKLAKEFFPDDEYPTDVMRDMGVIQHDKTYNHGNADLNKVQLFVDGVERVLFDMDARKTNIIDAPVIGSELKTDLGHILGGQDSFPDAVSYQELTKNHGIPLNVGKNKNKYTPITCTVVEYAVDPNQRYLQYDVFNLKLKVNDIEGEDVFVSTNIKGHIV